MIPLWRVYEDTYFFITLAGGILCGLLIGLLSSSRSWSLLRTALISVVVYALVSVPLAVPDATLLYVLPSFDGLMSAFSGIVASWKELVTITPPVGTYEALLIPVLLLSFVGSLVAVSATQRIQRGNFSNVAAVVPLVTLGLSIWLGTREPFAVLAIASGVFALIALWFASEKAVSTKSTLRSLGVIGLALAVVAITAISVPALQRSVWRAEIDVPFVLQDTTSPLSEYRTYMQGQQATSVMLTASGLESGDRLSLAVLESYNGVIYSVSNARANFTRIPGKIDISESGLLPVTAQVDIQALRGPWVPLPGALGDISFSSQELSDAFYYNRTSHTGALVSGITQGDTYQATGYSSPWIEISNLDSLKPGDAYIPAPEVIPEGIDAFMATYAIGTTTAGERLQQSLTALINQGYISHGQPDEPVSASGHGANRIAELFSSPIMVGDAEQYSVAAALMARQAGFPSRVVMGFIAPDSATGESLSFLGEDMTAWVELSTNQGWVALDPNPEPRPIPEEQPEQANEVSFPQTALDPPQEQEPQINDDVVPENAEQDPTQQDNALAELILTIVNIGAWLLLIIGLISSPLLIIGLIKHRRRKRRRYAATSQEQVMGAWDEARDLLVDSGQTYDPSKTRAEFANQSQRATVSILATQADRAQFAAEEVPAIESEEAWEALSILEQEIAAQSRLRKKISTRFSLNSLRSPRGRFTRWLFHRR